MSRSAGTVGIGIDFRRTATRRRGKSGFPNDAANGPTRRSAKTRRPASDHPFHRAELGIGADVLIGAFVSAQKLSRRCRAYGARCFGASPGSGAVFSMNPALRVRMSASPRQAASRGRDLCAAARRRANRRASELIDFVLDTMPFGGVNGTLEALTWRSRSSRWSASCHGERSTCSILAHLGVTDTVAQTGEEYVEIACRLALDPVFMSGVRSAIRSRLAESPLADGASYTRSLERAYVTALSAKVPDVATTA
jgi:hypothetical protein